MIIAPAVGIKVSADRLLEYHEKGEKSGATKGTHYTGDIMEINNPAIQGVALGGIALISSITFSILLWKESRSKNTIKNSN